ncbi:unnamed protein product [Dimorphilus gyrociliatus]|uniref:VWFA domain-containing protein n=1 Tax=Dimorphilus gyrociliatus TaxID=2664684 RepID=A0A7I8VDS5_9ANNE|nr:unnamed protein product [Dimorphilus gyrociliatus]
MSKSDDCGSPSASAVDGPSGAAAAGIMPMDVVISFDTTGSMSSYLAEVRAKMSEIIERLFTDLPTLRIGVIAHGDYCDKRTYITKHHELSNNVADLVDFVNKVGTTGGGDWEECYELVLHEARTKVNWVKGEADRALIMIGDAIPHEPNYSLNTKKLNWRKETLSLYEDLGVKIYGIQCGTNPKAKPFYEKIAKATGGKHLDLNNLGSIVDMLMAICYRERGAEMYDAFELEVREREGAALKADLDKMFKDLRDDDVEADAAVMGDVTSDGTPTKPSMFRKASSSKLAKTDCLKKVKPKSVRRTVRKAGAAKVGAAKPSAAKLRSKRKLIFESDSHSDSDSESKSESEDEVVVKKAKKSDDKKADKKVKKSEAKKDKNVRLNREDLKTDKFSTEDGLAFGNWRLAMAPKRSVKKFAKYSWSLIGKTTLARNQLWTNCKARALYEIAIQLPNKRKMGVACLCSKWTNPKLWKNNLIKKTSGFNEKIADAVQKGYKIFIRRAPLPLTTKSLRSSSKSGPQIIDELNGRFDYAWHKPTRDIY